VVVADHGGGWWWQILVVFVYVGVDFCGSSHGSSWG